MNKQSLRLVRLVINYCCKWEKSTKTILIHFDIKRVRSCFAKNNDIIVAVH